MMEYLGLLCGILFRISDLQMVIDCIIYYCFHLKI